MVFFCKIGKQNKKIDKIYEEINVRLEAVSNKLHQLIGYIIVPMLTQFPIILSFVKYIWSDYSNESFQQIYPAA